MKHIKLFETFNNINENSSDDHISDVLALKIMTTNF